MNNFKLNNSKNDYWGKRKKDDDGYRQIVNKTEKSVKALEERMGKEYKRVYEDMLLGELANLYSKWQIEKDDFSLTNILRYDWINRYSDKLKEIAKELGVKEEELLNNHLKDVFNITGNDTVKRMKVDDGIYLKGNFSIVPKHFAEQVMNSNWSGANFSSRIWKNKNQLTEKLKNTIMKGVLEGRSFTDMTLELQKILNSDYKNTKRLVRTETMNVINQAQILNYKNNGIEYVRVNGRNDGRACGGCISRFENREVFPIDEAPYLPSHANCRCSYIPVVDVPKTKEELAKEKEEKEFTDFDNYDDFKKKYENSMKAFNKKFKSDVMESGVLEKYIYNMDPKERKLFLKHFNEVNFKYTRKGSHYCVDANNNYKGYINFDKEEFLLRVKMSETDIETLLHEFGHYIHLDVGEPLKWWIDSKIGFDRYGSVADNDSKIIKKLMEQSKNGDKVAEEKLKKLKLMLYRNGGLSDCFGALTNNEFLGHMTHSKNYWSRSKQERFCEMFANIFEIKTRYGVNSEEYKIIKEFMPQSLALYEEIIGKIARKGKL